LKPPILILAVALAFPIVGFAQHAAPPPASKAPPESVTVVGQRPTREQRDKIVWDFVYAHAKLAPRIDQLSRWTVPICPEVLNLPGGFADFITARIKAVAKSAGAPVADPCKKNVEIVFTSDPQAFIDDVAKKKPMTLGYHFLHQIEAMAKVTKPIQTWYVTATSNLLETYIDDPYHPPPSGRPGSRLSHGQISVFANVLILVDSKKAAGYSVGEIADYLAMLSLSEADAPNNCGELPSILDLMSPDCAAAAPEALTAADKSYLEGLYAMEEDEIGSLQKSGIANIIKHDFDGK
jgi:hypothetical protein